MYKSRRMRYVSLILLYVTCCVTGSYAQYEPMVKEGRFWIYQKYNSSEDNTKIGGFAITFAGDTMVSNQLYKKIVKLTLVGDNPYVPYYSCWEFVRPYESSRKEIVGLIREDTIGRKIYTRSLGPGLLCEDDDSEQGLLDFSLTGGDTLNPCAYNTIWADEVPDNQGGIVDSVAMYESHGKVRRTIFTRGWYHSLGLPFDYVVTV